MLKKIIFLFSYFPVSKIYSNKALSLASKRYVFLIFFEVKVLSKSGNIYTSRRVYISTLKHVTFLYYIILIIFVVGL